MFRYGNQTVLTDSTGVGITPRNWTESSIGLRQACRFSVLGFGFFRAGSSKSSSVLSLRRFYSRWKIFERAGLSGEGCWLVGAELPGSGLGFRAPPLG